MENGPSNPGTGVGLLAAAEQPTAANLRVSEVCRPTSLDASMLVCRLCGHRTGRTIYVYMEKGFCCTECRYEFFLGELFEERVNAATVGASMRTRRAVARGMRLTEEEDEKFRRVFFACDEAKPLP